MKKRVDEVNPTGQPADSKENEVTTQKHSDGEGANRSKMKR